MTFDNFAFISYKREDYKWAEWLQKKLEHYRLPSKFYKENNDLPKSISPIVRDVSDFSAGNLKETIENELCRSKYLIVICSPNASKSKWVSKEVKHFIDSGRAEYIIPFIVDGIAHSGDYVTECLPQSLLELPEEKEILGVNIAELGREAALVKTVSYMLDLKFDTLWERHNRTKKRNKLITIAISLLILTLVIGLSIFGLINRQEKTFLREQTQIRFALELTSRGEPLTALLLLDSLSRSGRIMDISLFESTLRTSLATYNHEGSIIPLSIIRIINDFSFSHNGKTFAVSGADTDLSPITIVKKKIGGNITKTYQFPAQGKLALSTDGNYLLISSDKSLLLFSYSDSTNTWTSKSLLIPKDWTKLVTDMGFSPNENILYHTHKEGTIMYNLKDGSSSSPLLEFSDFHFCSDSTIVASNSIFSSFLYLKNQFEVALQDVDYLGYNQDWGYAIFQDNEDLDLLKVDISDLENKKRNVYVLRYSSEYMTSNSDSLVRFVGMNNEGSKAYFINTTDNDEEYLGYIRTGYQLEPPYRYCKIYKKNEIKDIYFSSNDNLAIVTYNDKESLTLFRPGLLEEVRSFVFDEPYRKVIWVPNTYLFVVQFDSYLKVFDSELLQTVNISPGMNMLYPIWDQLSSIISSGSIDYYIRRGCQNDDWLRHDKEYIVVTNTDYPFRRNLTLMNDSCISDVTFANNLLSTISGEGNPFVTIDDIQDMYYADSSFYSKNLVKALDFNQDGSTLYVLDKSDSLFSVNTSKLIRGKGVVRGRHLGHRLIASKENVLKYNIDSDTAQFYVYDSNLLFRGIIDLGDDGFLGEDQEILFLDEEIVLLHDTLTESVVILDLDKMSCRHIDEYIWISPKRRYLLDDQNQLWDCLRSEIIHRLDTDIYDCMTDPEESFFGHITDSCLIVYEINNPKHEWKENIEISYGHSLNSGGIVSMRQKNGEYQLKDMVRQQIIGVIPSAKGVLDFNLTATPGSLSPDHRYFARIINEHRNNLARLCVWEVASQHIIYEKAFSLMDNNSVFGGNYELNCVFSPDGRFLHVLKDNEYYHDYPLFWGNYDDLLQETRVALESKDAEIDVFFFNNPDS